MNSSIEVLAKSAHFGSFAFMPYFAPRIPELHPIESGKTPQPSVQKVIDLAYALEVGIEELLILEVEVRLRGRPRKVALEEGAASG